MRLTPRPTAPYQPGDVLLYGGTGFFSRLIRIKTWSSISHCEVVCHPSEVYWRRPHTAAFNAVASRDGVGVGLYPPDDRVPLAALRPIRAFDQATALEWFWRDANGQGYDWFGLLAFFSAKRQGKDNQRMFCSEFAARYLRAGGVDPFNGYDADGIAPGEFLKSPAFRAIEVWDGRPDVAPVL